MYPAWLLTRMTFASRQTAVAALRGRPEGSFAIVKESRATLDHMGRPITQEFALHQTRGNTYLANLMMSETDPNSVRVVFRTRTGTMSLPVATERMCQFTSIEGFCDDFSRGTGHAISKDQFWIPRTGVLG